MKKLILACLCVASSAVFAQKEDFIWTIGYDGNPAPGFQSTKYDFSENQLKISQVDFGLEFNWSNANISNDTGLLFYTNGCQVRNGKHQQLVNGDTIINTAFEEFCVGQGAYKVHDGAIALPWPAKNGIYAIVQVGVHYQYQPVFTGWTSQLSYSVVNMNANNYSGMVEKKDVPILLDSLGGGQLEAVRHANGRDWWLIQSRLKTNKYLIFLFDPNGIHLAFEQFIGPNCEVNQGWMQACFSPDGSKYAKTYNREQAWLFDFDRCSGYLSNFRRIDVVENDSTFNIPSNEICFSPNGRFLYITNIKNLFQYDLLVTDINNSRIKIESYTANLTFPDYFGRMEVGPDGKIYMNVLNGTDVMHIINNPDALGLECSFKRAAIKFPPGWFYWGLPNQPNWRLGPLDGSACDTLGIDNFPWAHWRWRADTTSPLEAHFKDLSGFAPTDWHWTFGDGQVSDEQSPMHPYAVAGTYDVCEIVSNAFGADTFCRVVTVQTVSIPMVFDEDELKTAPNPVSDEWNLYFQHPLERDAELAFFDVGGRLVFSEKIKAGTAVGQVSLGALPNGLFVWQLSQRGVFLKTGRVVKMD